MNKSDTINHALGVTGWFEPEDMHDVWDMVTQNATVTKKVIEVGSWKGRSSYVIASACKDMGAKLTCIDSFKGLLLGPDHIKWGLYHGDGGYYQEGNYHSVLPEFKENLKEFIPDTVSYIEGDSREAHNQIDDESCDVVFIDGDHDEPVIGQDLRNYFTKVRHGGLFCGDDYEAGNNVSGSLANFMAEKASEGINLELIPTNSTLWMMKRP